MEEKYNRLVRELVMPESWREFFTLSNSTWNAYDVRPEHRERVMEAGVKRFDERYSIGKSIVSARMAARHAMRKRARLLEQAHRKKLDNLAPKILSIIETFIAAMEARGENSAWEIGYAVAAHLKELGYSWEQVRTAINSDIKSAAYEYHMPIEIKYTGVYD